MLKKTNRCIKGLKRHINDQILFLPSYKLLKSIKEDHEEAETYKTNL